MVESSDPSLRRILVDQKIALSLIEKICRAQSRLDSDVDERSGPGFSVCRIQRIPQQSFYEHPIEA
jgi:hypothetical protein